MVIGALSHLAEMYNYAILGSTLYHVIDNGAWVWGYSFTIFGLMFAARLFVLPLVPLLKKYFHSPRSFSVNFPEHTLKEQGKKLTDEDKIYLAKVFLKGSQGSNMLNPTQVQEIMGWFGHHLTHQEVHNAPAPVLSPSALPLPVPLALVCLPKPTPRPWAVSHTACTLKIFPPNHQVKCAAGCFGVPSGCFLKKPQCGEGCSTRPTNKDFQLESTTKPCSCILGQVLKWGPFVKLSAEMHCSARHYRFLRMLLLFNPKYPTTNNNISNEQSTTLKTWTAM